MASNSKKDEFSLSNVLLRVVAPLVIVLVTYNPSGYSFYTWFSNALAGDGLTGIHFLTLVVLVICWSILLIATWKSLDAYGVVLICALLGAIVWVLIDWGLLNADSSNAVAWIVLVCAAIVLAVGLSWAIVWRRITGQYAVDEIED
jgi:hypothetical protein